MSEFSFRKWMASFPIRKWSRYEIPVVTARFLEIVTRALIAWTRFLPTFCFSFLQRKSVRKYLHLVTTRHETTNIDHTNRRTKRDILQDEQHFFLRYINHSLIFASLVLSSYLKKRRNRKTMNGGGYRLLRNVLVKFLVKRSHSFVDRNIITILKQMYMVQNNFNCKYQFISTNVLHVRTW